MNIEEIRELKDYYIKTLYSDVRKEQEIDNTYYNDTFAVPEVRKPHRVWRSGWGNRMVDSPSEQIVTSNPQAYFEMIKGSKDIEAKLSGEVNKVWFPVLSRKSPNSFKEFVKNVLCRGESYIQLVHNEDWVSGDREHSELPVLFLVPESMVLYGSPEEDENGIPDNVIVYYERQPKDVILRYPDWTNPKNAGIGKSKDKSVSWFEYWDKDNRYFEADGEPVLQDQIQENIYGFTPFIRRYSGFGRRSPDGSLSSLIVSDIKFSRDLIHQECVKRSNIYSVEDLFSHRSRTFMSPGKIGKEQIRNLKFGSYDVNLLEDVPAGTTMINEEYSPVPQEMYGSHAALVGEIVQRHPFTQAGFPFGSSGRHEDITASAAMARYNTVIQNTESAFATAVEKALEMCNVIPKLRPTKLTESDLASKFKCSVILKAESPVEQDRLATLGSRLLVQNEIDPETNLIEYKGYTQDKAKDILVKIMMWKVLLNSPDVIELIGLRAAEKSGMAEDLQIIKTRRQQVEKGTKILGNESSPTAQQRIQGEVQTEMGREMGIQSMVGARTPPERYNRGGA